MRSSLPVEQRVLNDRNANPQLHQPQAQQLPVSRFTAFVRSAKARFLQDLKGSLPVPPDLPAPTIQRHNVTCYEDEPGQQLLIVYAPDGGQSLEFVSLALLPPSPRDTHY